MAVELATAYVSLIPSAQGITSKLGSELTGPLVKAGRDAGDKTSKEFAGRFKFGLAGVAAIAAGSIGGTLVLRGIAGLSHSLGDLVAQARDSAKVGRLTNQVLQSTGGVAGVTAGQVNDLATRLSNLTGVDDELIQSGENVLLTFTNVRNSVGKGNDIFNQATKAAVDMSAALGTDLQGSVIQLGKALNDPIKGVTALQRVGVSFTQQQKDQIKTLVESGRTLEAQKIVLKEVATEFGGAAAAAADPMARLQVIVGNFKEQLGGALLPVIGQTANALGTILPEIANSLAPAIAALAPTIGSALSSLITAAAPLAAVVGQELGAAFKVLGPILDQLAPVTASVAASFGEIGQALIPVIPALGAVLNAVAPLFAAFAALGSQLAGAIAPVVVQLAGVLTDLTVAFVGTEKAPGPLIGILQAVGAVVEHLGAALLPVVLGVLRSLSPVFEQFGVTLSKIAPVLAEVGSAIGTAFGQALALVAPIIGRVASLLGGALLSVLRALTPVIAPIGSVIAGLIRSFAAVAVQVASAVLPVFNELVKALVPLIPSLGQIATALGGALLTALRTLGPAVGDIASALGRGLVQVIQALEPQLPSLAKSFVDIAKSLAEILVAVVPLIPPLVKLGTTLITEIGAPAIAAIAGALAALATALTPILANSKLLTPVLAALAAGFAAMKIVNAINLAPTAIGLAALKVQALAAAVATKVFAVAQGILNVVMDANPIVLVVAALAAIAAAVVIAYVKFKPFREVVDAVGRALAKVAQVIVGGLTAAFNFIKTHWQLVLGLIVAPFITIPILIGQHLDEIVGFFAGLGGRIASALSGLGSAIVGAVTAGIGNFISVLPDAGRALINGFINGIRLQLLALGFVLIDVPLIALRSLGNLALTLIPKGIELIAGLTAGIVRKLPDLALFWATLPLKILAFVGSLQLTLFSKGVEIVAGFVVGLIHKLPDVVSFFTGLPLRILALLGNIGNALVSKGVELLGGFASGIVSGFVDVTKFFSELPGRVIDAIGDIGNILFDIGKKLLGGLVDGAKSALGSVKDFFGGIAGDIVSWKGPPAKDAVLLVPIGRLILKGLVRGVKEELPALRAQLAQVSSVIAGSFSPNVDTSKAVPGFDNPATIAAALDRLQELIAVESKQEAATASFTAAQEALRSFVSSAVSQLPTAANAISSFSSRMQSAMADVVRAQDVAGKARRDLAAAGQSQADIFLNTKALQDAQGGLAGAQAALAAAASPADFIRQIQASTKQAGQFQDDLRRLVAGKFPLLAAELAKAGPETARKLADALAGSPAQAKLAEAALRQAQSFSTGFSTFLDKNFSASIGASGLAAGTIAGNSIIDGARQAVSGAGDVLFSELVKPFEGKALTIPANVTGSISAAAAPTAVIPTSTTTGPVTFNLALTLEDGRRVNATASLPAFNALRATDLALAQGRAR